VNYSGWSDLELWKKLLSSDRLSRKKSIMKPSELTAFKKLPWKVTAYRAHRPNEIDWLSYTLNPVIAARFAREREVENVTTYKISRSAILVLFLRRGEEEIIVLDKERAIYQNDVQVIAVGERITAEGDGATEDEN
jgi:hypothetical protein